MYLNKDVAVRVAATLMNAVVAAVVMIVVVGIGTSISVNGISTICASGGWGGLVDFGFDEGGSSFGSIGLTPGGGLRVLGGATSGL
tara:strand:- start:280 stop:537 length:258 start_codon:yes stop_codon:yes gene_type:complete